MLKAFKFGIIIHLSQSQCHQASTPNQTEQTDKKHNNYFKYFWNIQLNTFIKFGFNNHRNNNNNSNKIFTKIFTLKIDIVFTTGDIGDSSSISESAMLRQQIIQFANTGIASATLPSVCLYFLAAILNAGFPARVIERWGTSYLNVVSTIIVHKYLSLGAFARDGQYLRALCQTNGKKWMRTDVIVIQPHYIITELNNITLSVNKNNK